MELDLNGHTTSYYSVRLEAILDKWEEESSTMLYDGGNEPKCELKIGAIQYRRFEARDNIDTRTMITEALEEGKKVKAFFIDITDPIGTIYLSRAPLLE